MKQLKVNKLPLYLQVQQHLLDLIKDKTFSPGDRLPSEAELSSKLGVSRPTLREALKSLEQEGVILRKHGVGSFISSHSPVMESGLEVLESLDRIARRKGLSVEVAHLNVDERPATNKERKLLALPQNGLDYILDVERIIKIDNKAVAFLKDTVPLSYLRKTDLEGRFTSSILDMFLNNGEPVPVISRADVEAVNAEADIASLLEIKKGTALIKLTGQLLNFDDKILDYSITYFIPGRIKFNIMRRVAT